MRRPWAVLGGGPVLLGIVVASLGFFKVYEVYSAYQELSQFLGSSYSNALMWKVFEPYFLPSILCFMVGGIGVAVDASKKGEEQKKVVLKPAKNAAAAELFDFQLL